MDRGEVDRWLAGYVEAAFPLHRPSPPPATDEQELRRALNEPPRWVKAAWATAGRRVSLSIGVLGLAAWILVSALSDRDVFFDHRASAAGFVAAAAARAHVWLAGRSRPFGDLRAKRDSVPVFQRLGWWLDRRGLPLSVSTSSSSSARSWR